MPIMRARSPWPAGSLPKSDRASSPTTSKRRRTRSSLRTLGRAIAREWLLTGRLPVVRVLSAEEQKAKEILARHTDKDWTLCDAISFALLDARRVTRTFTFDHHFQQYGRIQVLGLNR